MFAFLNGHNLFLVDRGDSSAMPVVFVHGFPMSHELWLPQIDRCAERYRAVAYDVVGHGRSDIGDGQYSIEAHVDDLISLMDHLKIPRAVVVGLSMGGYITLRALERNPDRFLAAVLCDTRSEADTNEGKIKRFAGVAQVKREGSRVFADGFVKLLFAPSSLQRVPEDVERIRNIIAHTPPLGIAGTLLALAARTDTTAALSSIFVPTLLLVGEHDVHTPPAAAESMHKRIPGSRLHVIPGAGHLPNLENPEAFDGALTEYLGRLSFTKER